jgi:hypothetical protein
MNQVNYTFGWIAMGVYDGQAIPTSGWCLNAGFADVLLSLIGSSVSLTECYGTFLNELWAYDNRTKGLVMMDVNGVDSLCLDGLSLTMAYCNLSATGQQWNLDSYSLRNGQQYLWGWPGTELSLNSSQPSGPATCNFTFLSIESYAPRSTAGDHFNTEGRRHFNKEGLLNIANLSVNQIANGDFETTSLVLKDSEIAYSTFSSKDIPTYLILGGWALETAPIDYLVSTLI